MLGKYIDGCTDETADGSASSYGVYYVGQTITPTYSFYITGIKLYMEINDTPDDLTIGIYTTDGNDDPVTLLTTTSISYTDVSTSSDWIDISFPDPCPLLNKDIKYIIVLSSAGSVAPNMYIYTYDYTSPSYTGGTLRYSNDGGGTWGSINGDILFKLYGFRFYKEGDGLRIYVSGNTYPYNCIECWCKRWDEDNYNVILETFLSSGARNFLFENVIPGAVTELYNILGTPYYRDVTYSSGNTLIYEPQDGWGVSGLREKRTIAVKSINDSFANKDSFNVKIEGYRIDI